MTRPASPPDPGRLLAVLGPTNTGKTHFAVERMLGHRTGVIGLPLRLLAREIYDRVAAAKGARAVALVTGEEKIVPGTARYFVCTVESMPLGRAFDFLAVDEIQLAADPERGHVFTDRLLRARGALETMFLGSDTIRPLLRRLVPETEILSRPRLSTLGYAGPRKLSRLPRRSAIVAFSAAEVYAIAELARRQRGGAAVVMGALSPRTRNAQVAMYQAGDVDFLVATDAIGMGLNMAVDHIAFAALGKFDGAGPRPLSAAEIGQIAGRAGRYLNDGTFGTTADAGALDEDVVTLVEDHRFPRLRALRWRNADLGYASIDELIRSLEAPSRAEYLVRPRGAVDQAALRALALDAEITRLARGPAAVRLLWQVCQIPDFRKTMADTHARLLGRIYRQLLGPDERLDGDWVARQVAALDRTEGDIDTLAGRISHIRTWTFVSHRNDWLADAPAWQERTRAIEDRLSDALHERLTQRFVDRRTAVLVRRLRDRDGLATEIGGDGEVRVETHFIGRLEGLGFVPDPGAGGAETRTLRAAAKHALRSEIAARTRQLCDDGDDAFRVTGDGRVEWRGATVARLAAGDRPLRPQLVPVAQEYLNAAARERVRRRLGLWLDRHVGRLLEPLVRLKAADLAGAARGLVFQIAESFGACPRRAVSAQLAALAPADRRRLRRLGVRFGEASVFLPALTKPDRARLAGLLWAVHDGIAPVPAPPQAGLVSVAADPATPEGFYRAVGFGLFGCRAIRLDMIERLAGAARKLSRNGPFAADHELLSLVGCGQDDFAEVMRALGYRSEARDGAALYVRAPPARRGRRRGRPRTSDSPFADLGKLAAGRSPGA